MINYIKSADFDERYVKYFLISNVVLTIILAIISYFSGYHKFATGVIIGGLITNINSRGLYKDCLRTVRFNSIFVYYLGVLIRLGLIAIVVTLLLMFYQDIFSVVGLFLGLSVGVINFYLTLFVIIVSRISLIKFKREVST